jgi:hypothetical protein
MRISQSDCEEGSVGTSCSNETPSRPAVSKEAQEEMEVRLK